MVSRAFRTREWKLLGKKLFKNIRSTRTAFRTLFAELHPSPSVRRWFDGCWEKSNTSVRLPVADKQKKKKCTVIFTSPSVVRNIVIFSEHGVRKNVFTFRRRGSTVTDTRKLDNFNERRRDRSANTGGGSNSEGYRRRNRVLAHSFGAPARARIHIASHPFSPVGRFSFRAARDGFRRRNNRRAKRNPPMNYFYVLRILAPRRRAVANVAQ